MTEKTILTIMVVCLLILSMALLISVSWKVALGVFLFGWMINIDNKIKLKK